MTYAVQFLFNDDELADLLRIEQVAIQLGASVEKVLGAGFATLWIVVEDDKIAAQLILMGDPIFHG